MKLTTKREVAGYELHFTWHGGPYIDIGFTPESAFDVINVWHVEARIPTIQQTQEGFEDAVDEYVNDPETDHAADLANFAHDHKMMHPA